MLTTQNCFKTHFHSPFSDSYSIWFSLLTVVFASLCHSVFFWPGHLLSFLYSCFYFLLLYFCQLSGYSPPCLSPPYTSGKSSWSFHAVFQEEEMIQETLFPFAWLQQENIYQTLNWSPHQTSSTCASDTWFARVEEALGDSTASCHSTLAWSD